MRTEPEAESEWAPSERDRISTVSTTRCRSSINPSAENSSRVASTLLPRLLALHHIAIPSSPSPVLYSTSLYTMDLASVWP